MAVLGDDPVATRAVGQGLARAQAQHRRVFMGDLLGEGTDDGADATPGLSDMIRYGVSLSRAARPHADSPNLYTVEAGAESPLAEDILRSSRWRTLSEQVHRSGALLLLIGPSRVPNLAELLAQLDGIVVVGDAAPQSPVPVLSAVRSAATMRTPPVAAKAVTAKRNQGSWPYAALALAVILALVAMPQVRQPLGRFLKVGRGSAAPVTTTADSSAMAIPDVPPRLTSDAAWSMELRFLNSRVDAEAAVAALVDSFPAATFSEVRTAQDSTMWYRVLIGAFSDSISAENFLAALRTRGVVPSSGGSVTHVPFALLVDSATDNAMARLRVSAFHGRGLPAYALRDSSNVWHVYVGAFSESADAGRFKLELDSLNIQSVLVVRAGSSS